MLPAAFRLLPWPLLASFLVLFAALVLTSRVLPAGCPKAEPTRPVFVLNTVAWR